MANVNPIPPGYRTLTSYLVVKDGRAQLEFLKTAFDAKVEHELLALLANLGA